MKVGIITYHRAINYGAFLQAYALCSKLNEEDDIEAEIIDYNMAVEKKLYGNRFNKNYIIHPIISFMRIRMLNKQKNLFREEYKKLRLTSEHVISDNFCDFNRYASKQGYDAIICGSDEIWKIDGIRGFPNAYWLIGDIGCKKYSYAASSRSDFSTLNKDSINKLKSALNDFEFIGVRDNLTFRQVIKYINDKSIATICCDPTFLYDFKPNKKRGQEILKRITKKSKEKTIVVMMENNNMANNIFSRLKDHYNLVCVYLWHPKYINGCELNPFDWIDVLCACDFVITSFFHAVCFSIKHNTPFMAIGTRDKSSKLNELAREYDNKAFQIYEPKVVKEERLNAIIENLIINWDKTQIIPDRFYVGYDRMLRELRK